MWYVYDTASGTRWGPFKTYAAANDWLMDNCDVKSSSIEGHP